MILKDMLHFPKVGKWMIGLVSLKTFPIKYGEGKVLRVLLTHTGS